VTGKHQHLVDAGAKPSLPASELTAAGLAITPPTPEGAKLSLLDFDTDDGTEYWIGLDNFYAIMRYNPRTKYAMAVYQLSEAIRELHAQQPPAGSPGAG
ncbi:MAG: lytic murein transglycosylase, partial [Zoogloeaceae bacterium]|nr:lytic murein transglycosylase [Zoogloeaceae bacterium]